MNETRSFRRVAAAITIGSFSIAALMGIVALLGGGEFGEGEAKVLLTTLVVGCASICALCYLATAGTRFAVAGIAGAVVLVMPTATALYLIWSDWSGDLDGVLKAFGVGVVGAVTLAQICLLLAVAGAREGLRVLLGATIVLASVVAAIVSALIVGELDADGVWRVLGIAAILDVLGTLVTIALAKFGGRDEPEAAAEDLRVRLTPEQAAAVDAVGRSTGRSREQVVRDVLEQFLTAQRGK